MSEPLSVTHQLCLPPVLDACCGPRMMWFDKADPRALFIDKRQEVVPQDASSENIRWLRRSQTSGVKPANPIAASGAAKLSRWASVTAIGAASSRAT